MGMSGTNMSMGNKSYGSDSLALSVVLSLFFLNQLSFRHKEQILIS